MAVYRGLPLEGRGDAAAAASAAAAAAAAAAVACCCCCCVCLAATLTLIELVRAPHVQIVTKTRIEKVWQSTHSFLF